MKLARLQQAFQTHLLRADAAILPHIQEDARATARLRLGVYTHAYVLRLIEVLGESFPALRGALGEAGFARLMGEFVRAHPSTVRSARDYGAQLPQWLGARARGARSQGLADLARFEWAVAAAFDAADAPALAPGALSAVAVPEWPALVFRFAPSLRRLSVASNCVAWWRHSCASGVRPTRWRLTRSQEWLVWRRDLAVYYRALSAREARVLDAARAGECFAQLCERVPTAARAAALLRGWFEEGLVMQAGGRGATGA